MDYKKLQLGGVYQTYIDNNGVRFFNDPIRVMIFDRNEVFFTYDVEKKDLNSNSRRKLIFYRGHTATFLKDVKFLRTEPLSEDEKEILRPDLPMRLCRTKTFDLRKHNLASLKKFELGFPTAERKKLAKEKLKAAEVILGAHVLNARMAFGGSPSKEKLRVKPHNGEFFTGIELAWLSAKLAKKIGKPIGGPGLSIVRSGVENRIPTYTVKGYYSYWQRGYDPDRD